MKLAEIHRPGRRCRGATEATPRGFGARSDVGVRFATASAPRSGRSAGGLPVAGVVNVGATPVGQARECRVSA